MASTAFLPEGATFKIGDGATPTEAFVTTANVNSITVSGGESEEIDVTTLDSVGRYKEYISGFKDPGNVELGVFFNPDEGTHVGGTRSINALYVSGATFNWRVVFDTPLGDTCTISGIGFIKSEPTVALGVGKASEGTITIRRRGATTIAVA